MFSLAARISKVDAPRDAASLENDGSLYEKPRSIQNLPERHDKYYLVFSPARQPRSLAYLPLHHITHKVHLQELAFSAFHFFASMDYHYKQSPKQR